MSEMVEVKTAEIEGASLDWAVAKGVGHDVSFGRWGPMHWGAIIPQPVPLAPDQTVPFNPSMNWAQGGPLIDKYIGLSCVDSKVFGQPFYAETKCTDMGAYANGHTYLVASMRAIVAAEMGETVQVPKELA